MNHFLAVGEHIAHRLRERLHDDIRVLTTGDMTAVRQQPANSVQVVYDGYQPEAPRGSLTGVTQSWLTVVCVHDTKTAGRADEGTRSAAGPLLDDVLAALLRYRVPGCRPLTLAATFPPVYGGGFAFFPLAWETDFNLIAEDCCAS